MRQVVQNPLLFAKIHLSDWRDLLQRKSLIRSFTSSSSSSSFQLPNMDSPPSVVVVVDGGAIATAATASHRKNKWGPIIYLVLQII